MPSSVDTEDTGPGPGDWMPRAENKYRYLFAAVVAGLHIIVAVILMEDQSRTVHPYTATRSAMVVFLTMPTRRHPPFLVPAPLRRGPITIPIIGPSVLPAANGLRIEVPRSPDWIAAARQAAARGRIVPSGNRPADPMGEQTLLPRVRSPGAGRACAREGSQACEVRVQVICSRACPPTHVITGSTRPISAAITSRRENRPTNARELCQLPLRKADVHDAH